MAFWWFMSVCTLTVPIAFVAGGWLMWKHCPKEINQLVGYRTRRSMMNMDTWKFAHGYCGKLWCKLGFIMMPLSIIIMLPFMHSGDGVIGLAGIIIETVQIFIMVLSVILTEQALKKTFTENGIRR